MEAGAQACEALSLGIRSEETLSNPKPTTGTISIQKGSTKFPVSCRSMSTLVNGEQPLVVGFGPLRSERQCAIR